jgi:hypothetical protein
VTACATLGRAILAPAHLVDKLDWLNTTSVRRHVYTWREPTDVLAILAKYVAVR